MKTDIFMLSYTHPDHWHSKHSTFMSISACEASTHVQFSFPNICISDCVTGPDQMVTSNILPFPLAFNDPGENFYP